MAVKAPVRRRKRSQSPLPLLVMAVLVVALVGGMGIFAVRSFGHGKGNQTPQNQQNVTPVDSQETGNTGDDEEVVDTQPLIVCLDPGHGGKDPGTHAADGTLEKDDVLRLALAVRDAMEAQGIEVVMTRDDDTFVELEQRPAIANEAKADYLISFHRNSAEMDANGVEIWYSASAGEATAALAKRIEEGLTAAGVSRDRGANAGSQSGSGDYAVCRLSEMPAVLIEMGFMNSEEDNRLFNENMDAYADALTQAVLEDHEANAQAETSAGAEK